MTDKDKGRISFGPNAPQYVRDMFHEIFPEAEEISPQAMRGRMKQALEERDRLVADRSGRKIPTLGLIADGLVAIARSFEFEDPKIPPAEFALAERLLGTLLISGAELMKNPYATSIAFTEAELDAIRRLIAAYPKCEECGK